MKAIGIILAGGNNERLGLLTQKRATSAMPIGSCYRSIDFALSNMSNSGIGKVAVITQYNSRSLHDHLSSSKWWDLGRKQGGLFVFSPYLISNNLFWFRGTAESIYLNMTYLMKSNEPYVVIASGDGIYKIDYEEVLKEHIASQADVTIVYKRLKESDLSKYGILEIDENNRVAEFEEKPIDPVTDCASMGIYVIARTLLIKLLQTIQTEDRYDFVKDILIRYRKKINIRGFEFKGYWKAVNSIKNYFDANMDFLNAEVRELFTSSYPYVCTKPKDEPPAKYNYGAYVKNTLVGSGSILNGTVFNSVLFRKVYVGENSTVNNSIVMEGTLIGNNCRIEHAIIDKEVTLTDGKQIIGTYERPEIISKGSVL